MNIEFGIIIFFFGLIDDSKHGLIDSSLHLTRPHQFSFQIHHLFIYLFICYYYYSLLSFLSSIVCMFTPLDYVTIQCFTISVYTRLDSTYIMHNNVLQELF